MMETLAPQVLLVGAVIGVGVLHTIVPDHWIPITLIARQEGWSPRETAYAALKAGLGHVISTLLIGLVVWLAGAAFATRFGGLVSTVSSVALITFGCWIAIMSIRDLRRHTGHGQSHSHGHEHGHGHDSEALTVRLGIHGLELARIQTQRGLVELSIFEAGVPPRFRLTGAQSESVSIETVREDGSRQTFHLHNRGEYWESPHEIPEPHNFTATISLSNGGFAKWYTTKFSEHEDEYGHSHGHSHDHGHESDALYEPGSGSVALLTKHIHVHRHRQGPAHAHLHDHGADTWHRVPPELELEPPLHEHGHKRSARTALLLILGSSPMVEGIPAFFAAGKYGPGLIAVMSLAFGVSTILTYIALCVYSTTSLQRVKFGSFEKYGEVISGAFIAAIGLVFLMFPML